MRFAPAVIGACVLALCVSVLEAQQAQAEQRARELIARYYDELDQRELSPDLRYRTHEDCTGTSLAECFGGDPECVHPAARGTLLGLLCSEPARRTERAELLRELTALADVAPDNDWIVGQRVYLAWKQGDADAAWEIADACLGSGWWCQALRGFVEHQRSGKGEAHFDSAMTAVPRDAYAWVHPSKRPPMRDPIEDVGGVGARRYRLLTAARPPDRGVRCEWTDLTSLISLREPERPPEEMTENGTRVSGFYPFPPAGGDELLTQYQRLACGERASFEQRFWWLSDPLWSERGNERRSEHLARNVQRRLRDEILLRYERQEAAWSHPWMLALGAPNSWGGGYECSNTRSRCRVGVGSNPAGVSPGFSAPSHPHFNGGYSFVPDSARFLDPVRSTQDDWNVTWDSGHERMITRETWHNLEHYQSAVLRRGGRLRVLGAARLPVVLSSMDGVSATLAMGMPTNLSAQLAEARVEALGVVRASIEVDSGDWIASLEIQGEGWNARARHGALPPALTDNFGLSVPLLLEQRSAPDADPLDAMLPSTVVHTESALELYFELYGVSVGEELDYTVTMGSRSEPTLLGRIARSLRLGGPAAPVTIQWSEASRGLVDGALPRRLNVDPGGLEAGDYRLQLRVERADGTFAVSSRDLRVVR